MARALLWTLAILVGVFLLAPMLVVIPLSFSASEFLQFPPPGYTTRWYQQFFQDPTWTDAFWRSAKVAAVSTLLATVIGTAAAYALTDRAPRLRPFMEPIFALPMIVPVIVFAIGAYLVGVELRLVGSLWFLAVTHAVLAIPFVLINVSAGLRTVAPAMALAARSLGATSLTAFWLVTLPLIAPSVLTSAVIAAVLSFDEAVVALFLSPDIAPTFPVRMYSSIKIELDPVLPVAATLVVGATFALAMLAVIFRALFAYWRPSIRRRS